MKTTPKGLGPAGRAFWREMHEKFEFSPAELVLLEEACLRVDELKRIAAGLDGAEMAVVGARGQRVAHPLLDEVRRHTVVLAALVKQLTPAPAKSAESEISRVMSDVAMRRWRRAG